MNLIEPIEIEEDLRCLKDAIAFPSTIVASPFMFLVLSSEIWVTFILLAFPFYDYLLSRDGKLAKKYIRGFKYVYLSIFIASLVFKMIFVFSVNNILLILSGIALFFMVLYWFYTFWKGWYRLVDAAQQLP